MSNLLSMAQQFSGLPMEALIGGPLNAAAEGNANMAMTQTQFMLDTCFVKSPVEGGDEENGPFKYTPIMIDMTLTRGVITPGDPTASPPVETTIQPVETTFQLPLLTVIPLNSLGVDEVDIKFEMEVKSSYGEEKSKESTKKVAAEVSFEAKVGFGPFSAKIRGSASYDKQDRSSFSSHYEKSNSAKYTVSVHAGQLPLPKGVNTIIDAFTKSVEPLQLPKDATE